jgi:DNA replication protein DnaC
MNFDELRNPPTRDDSCEAHGAFIAKQIFKRWTGCPECERLRRLEADEIDRKEAGRREEERLERSLENAGISPRFRQSSLENFMPIKASEKAIHEAMKCYGNRLVSGTTGGQSNVFIGKPGTGKTHIGRALGALCVRAKMRARIETTAEIIRAIKGTWSKDSTSSEEGMIDWYAERDFLVIDEVGVQFGSDTERRMLFEIVDIRYQYQRPTLFISNHTLKEVQGFLGERVFDRLREDGGTVYVFDGESRRGQ